MGARSRRITPRIVEALTSPRTRALRRTIAEGRRRLAGEPHRVRYFHQAGDPYSHLAAQTLEALCARYDVVLEPVLAGPPSDAAAPERARLEAFARRDAADVAPGYGLSFPPGAGSPVPAQIVLAERVLAAVLAAGSFARFAPRVGDALWRGDAAGLEALAREGGATEPSAAKASVEAGSRLREQLGHYLGAMFHYGGEWYWGVDRLHHLERRLRALGAQRADAPPEEIAARPVIASSGPASSAPPGGRFTLEFYPSLRSPYTAIVIDRVLALPERHPVDLVFRPVLPMVMRGLPIPRAKQSYIILDTKREAEDAGVPFGRICDPVGRPVERAFSLHPWACVKGRGPALLREFLRAAFAEGIDTGSDEGLRRVVERAGLSWSEAAAHLDREGWRDALERNREQLFALGLWGVPSFRLLGRPGEPDFSTWGQDRLWRVEAEMVQRLAARASAQSVT